MIGQPVFEMASDLAEAPLWLGSLIEQINNVKASVTDQISSMNEKVDSVLRIVDDINEFKKSAANKVGELEGSVNFLSKSYDVMLTDQKKMQNTCDTILRDNEIQKRRVDTYEREIEDLQQYSRRNCILIHGIPEEREENTGELALDIFNNKLGLGVDLSELDRTHRLGPRPVADDDDTNSQDENECKIRPIIVKFLSYRVRSTVIKARRNLKGKKISITEALVKGIRDLLRKAQERVGFRNAWSYDGKIFA